MPPKAGLGAELLDGGSDGSSWDGGSWTPGEILSCLHRELRHTEAGQES